MNLSNKAGPKNQLVKTSHAAVTIAYLTNRRLDLNPDGLVKNRATKAAVVQAQACLMKMTFSQLDLLAK